MENGLAVRKVGFLFPNSADPQFAEEMAEQMAGVQIEFPRAKMPSGGMLVFDMDDEAPKALVGVIVEQHPVNAYWPDANAAEGNPPVCSAADGVTGRDVHGGVRACATCPFNAFGSAEGGKGKACKNKIRTHILRDGSMLPVQLDLPATSLKAFSKYMGYLRSRGLLPSSVVTEIGLERQSFNNNQVSVATFKALERLDPENARVAMEYARSIRRSARGFVEIPDEVFPE